MRPFWRFQATRKRSDDFQKCVDALMVEADQIAQENGATHVVNVKIEQEPMIKNLFSTKCIVKMEGMMMKEVLK